VNCGTSALHLALVLAGVKAGDEVITSAQTMMATAHAILHQQARPVFADIQYRTGTSSLGYRAPHHWKDQGHYSRALGRLPLRYG